MFVFTRIDRPVAVVRRPVGALLEGPHVTERAAVDAAHVRVQRPVEAHPLHRLSAIGTALRDTRRSSTHGTSIEQTFVPPTEIEPGILRLTLPLPTGPKHVHCYFLRGDDGWTLVDTGLGLRTRRGRRSSTRSTGRSRASSSRTSTPTTSAGAEAAAEATGAPVFQGAPRLRAVRARLGQRRLARADRRLVRAARRAAGARRRR